MRSFRVSRPCRNRNELNGLSAGPKSRSAFHARFHDVGEIAEGLVEADAVVAFARFQELREAAAIPRKAAAIDNEAADRRPMTADKLGGRMHHDIGAMFDGTAQVRRRKRVVDHQRQIVFVRNRRHRFNVEHVHPWVTDGFPIQHPGLRRNGAPEVLRIVGIDESGLDAEAPETHVELRIGAAIQRLGGHDLVAGLQQSGQRNKLRSLPARPPPELRRRVPGRPPAPRAPPLSDS